MTRFIKKTPGLILMAIGLSQSAFAQEILIDAACENATVNGIEGYVDVSEDGTLAIWNNATDDFLAVVDPAKHPPCQQWAGNQSQSTPQPTTTQTTPPTTTGGGAGAATNLTAAQITEIVNAHNTVRQRDGVTPNLRWAEDLAAFAQEWANTTRTKPCNLDHRPNKTVGENLYWASPTTWSDGTTEAQTITPTQVVNSWASEKQYYDYDSNTCNAPPGESCGHYTQIVWRNTTEVGCGMAICPDKGQAWVCNYRPGGNVSNQKPY